MVISQYVEYDGEKRKIIGHAMILLNWQNKIKYKKLTAKS